jgi:hypothetical protein
MSQSSVAQSVQGTLNQDLLGLRLKNSDGETYSSNDKKRRSRTINTSSFAIYIEESRSDGKRLLESEVDELN